MKRGQSVSNCLTLLYVWEGKEEKHYKEEENEWDVSSGYTVALHSTCFDVP